MRKLKVINLFAGPGAGKSTTAAGVFSLLKMHNINAELLTEFAKDLTWESRDIALSNQYYIWAKQYHKLFRLKDKVDIVITDSPSLLSILYTNSDTNPHFFTLVEAVFKQFDNINFLLNRTKSYNPKGRYQTEIEAKGLDISAKNLLDVLRVPYEEVPGNFEGINYITKSVLRKYFSIPELSVYLNKNLE